MVRVSGEETLRIHGWQVSGREKRRLVLTDDTALVAIAEESATLGGVGASDVEGDTQAQLSTTRRVHMVGVQ